MNQKRLIARRDGTHRDVGALGGVQGGTDGIRVDRVDDQHVDLARQQVLNVVVLLADIAVGIKKDQRVAVFGGRLFGTVAQLDVEGGLQRDLTETDFQVFGEGQGKSMNRLAGYLQHGDSYFYCCWGFYRCGTLPSLGGAHKCDCNSHLKICISTLNVARRFVNIFTN
jgi:hypothetical protein